MARDHYISEAAKKVQVRVKTPKTSAKGKNHTLLTENLRNKIPKRKFPFSEGSNEEEDSGNTKRLKMTIEKLEQDVETHKELYSGAKARMRLAEIEVEEEKKRNLENLEKSKAAIEKMTQYAQEYDAKVKERLASFENYVALSLEAEDPEAIKKMIRAGYGIMPGREPEQVESGPNMQEKPKDLQAQVLAEAIDKAKKNSVANVGATSVELSMVDRGSRIMDPPSVETTVDEEGDDLDLQGDGESTRDPLETNTTEGQSDLDTRIASMTVKTPNRADKNKVMMDNDIIRMYLKPNHLGNSKKGPQLSQNRYTITGPKYLKPMANIILCVISKPILLQFFRQLQ